MSLISAEELKKKIDNSESFTLLDVREAHEYYISDMDGTTRIPFHDLKERLSELDKNAEIITLCRSGNSASDAAEILEENGFSNVSTLKGGINEWARKIDPSLSEY